EGSAAHVEVFSKADDPAGRSEVRSDRPVKQREAQDEPCGPDAEEPEERQLSVEAEEQFTIVSGADPPGKPPPHLPDTPEHQARDADVPRRSTREHNGLVRVPQEDRE